MPLQYTHEVKYYASSERSLVGPSIDVLIERDTDRIGVLLGFRVDGESLFFSFQSVCFSDNPDQ